MIKDYLTKTREERRIRKQQLADHEAEVHFVMNHPLKNDLNLMDKIQPLPPHKERKMTLWQKYWVGKLEVETELVEGPVEDNKKDDLEKQNSLP